jgi:hypothetical protein
MCSLPAATIRQNPPPFVALTTSMNNFQSKDLELSIYPNPIQSSSVISFSLEKQSKINLSVYDICGKKIESLLDGTLNQGKHQITWIASNLKSGIYLVRLEDHDMVFTKKCCVLN